MTDNYAERILNPGLGNEDRNWRGVLIATLSGSGIAEMPGLARMFSRKPTTGRQSLMRF